jgi:hypothetical protein
VSIERIEGTAMRVLLEASGGAGTETGGAICYALPALDAPALNHAVPVDDEVDLDAVEAWFGALGTRWALVVTPDRAGLAREAEARGYMRTRPWMKFTRDSAPAPAPATGLRVEQAGRDRAGDFALALHDGNGIPADLPLTLGAATTVDNLHCFVAYADDEPAAVGVVYVEGGLAWLGAGATRPAFRRRGGQSALLAARVAKAVELGAHTLVTETGDRVEGVSHTSYDNILRAGFREQYARDNWLAP